MKNYEQFTNSKLNEGFFDIFKKLIGKITTSINKAKGGKEVKKIFDDHLQLIKDEMLKQANVDLNLSGGDASTVVKPNTTTVKESFILNYDNFLNEADVQIEKTPEQIAEEEKNNKLNVSTLKQKSALLDKILSLYQEKAIKLMNNVLVKYGGGEKNPKLKVIIDNLKDDFKLKFLEAKIEYLDKSGDKTIINQIKSERDNLSKDLTSRWNSLDKDGNVSKEGEILIGSLYRYKSLKDGIKTIKITKESPDKGKVFATYLVEQDGLLSEQSFQVENIDKEFKPDMTSGVTYNYYDEESKSIVPVTVTKYDETSKELKIKIKDGNEIIGKVGGLRDVVTPTLTPTT